MSRRRFFFCVPKINHKHHRTPWRSQRPQWGRPRPIPRTNSVSYALFVRIAILLLLYAVSDVFFVQIVSSLVLFYDGRRCRNERVVFTIVWWIVDPVCLASAKKSVPISPTESVRAAVLRMTTLSSPSSLKWFIKLSSLSLPCFATLTRKLLLKSPRKSAKLPAYIINWTSISNIRRKLKMYG